MSKIEFTFTNQRNGQRVHEYQADNTETAFEDANRKAQQLANKHQTAIAVTAWLEDREGATAYRYPKKKGRPPKPGALSNKERQAALRAKRLAENKCPCCGQPKPEKEPEND